MGTNTPDFARCPSPKSLILREGSRKYCFRKPLLYPSELQARKNILQQRGWQRRLYQRSFQAWPIYAEDSLGKGLWISYTRLRNQLDGFAHDGGRCV